MHALLLWLCTLLLAAEVPMVSGPALVDGAAGTPLACAIVASGDSLSYAAAGLPAGLTVDAATGFITGTPTTAGSSTVLISASNGTGSSSMQLTITIAAAATTPIVGNAGVFLVSGGSGCRIALTAPGATGFGASGGPGELGIDAATGVINGTPTSPGTYNVAVSAEDGTTTTLTTLVIQVLGGAVNAPTFTNLDPAAACVGAPFSYVLTTVPTGTCSVVGLPAGLAFDPVTRVISGTPTAAGACNLRLSAVGAGGGSATVLGFPISTPDPAAPLPTAADAIEGTVGSSLAWQAAASATASFQANLLPGGLSLDAGSGILGGIPAVAGASNIVITCSTVDATLSASTTMAVRINDIGFDGPSIGPVTPPRIAVGSTAAFAIPVTSTATPTIAVTNLPAGLVQTGRVVAGTATAAGRRNLRIAVISTNGTAITTLTTTVVAAVADSPLAAGSLSLAATQLSAFSARLPTSFPATSVLASGLPYGLTLDPVSGIISGTPIFAGDANLVVACLGSTGGSNPTMAVIRVAEALEPVFTQAGPFHLTAGMPASFHLAATTVGGLPAGMSFSAATQLVTGIPTTPGTSNLALAKGPASTTATVIVGAAVSGLAINDPGLLTGATDQPFSARLTATGTSLTWSATDLPPGLALDAASGIISGTPVANETATVGVSVTDGAATCRTTIVIRIGPGPSIPGGGTEDEPAVSGVSGGCGAGAAGILLLGLSLAGGGRRRAPRPRSP